MAWRTEMKPGEELVINGVTIIRAETRVRLEVREVPGAERVPIVKRPRQSDGGK